MFILLQDTTNNKCSDNTSDNTKGSWLLKLYIKYNIVGSLYFIFVVLKIITKLKLKVHS